MKKFALGFAACYVIGAAVTSKAFVQEAYEDKEFGKLETWGLLAAVAALWPAVVNDLLWEAI